MSLKFSISSFFIGLLVGVLATSLLSFMVLAPVLSVGSSVELPRTDTKITSTLEEPITVIIESKGVLFLQGKEVLIDDLPSHLLDLSKSSYEQRIYLRAGQGSDYGEVMKVMGRINAAGFTNIGLITDPR